MYKSLTTTVTSLQNGGSNGTGIGQMNYPSDINTDSSGNVYVIDRAINRVLIFAQVAHNLFSSDSSKNITSMMANKTTSIVPPNKTSIVSDNTITSNGKNITSSLPPPHAGISDQF